MPGSVTNIFISYGRKDSRDLAIRLRDDLEAVGFSVWLDLNEIAGGASWSQDIEAAIEHCHVMLALMSPAASTSQWCLNEQLRALRKGKRIIPMMSVAGSEPPLHLEHMNYLDFADLTRYDATFRDLLSDITAGGAFRQPNDARDNSDTPFKKPRQRTRTGYNDEKRNAPSFRRYLKKLRREDWLGARFWWPYFLFHFTDIHGLLDILQEDMLLSPFERGDDLITQWDKFVRLYFRPRTPDVYHGEGFRPVNQATADSYAPVPVYLLFDMESVICHPDARFSEGNPQKTGKTYQTPMYFRELPFEQIYHDSWFMPDQKEEIMRCREAQVVVPEALGLEALQLIWLRSEAEYETLQQLMPPELWRKWRDKITTRQDYHLFNSKRPFVESAALEDQRVRLRFNPCQDERDCGPYHAYLVVQYADGEMLEWQDEAFYPADDLVIDLPQPNGTYTVQLLLDGDLAFANTHTPELMLL